jgi:hypothetical protein
MLHLRKKSSSISAGSQDHFNPQIQVWQGLINTAPFLEPQFVQLLLRQAKQLAVAHH